MALLQRGPDNPQEEMSTSQSDLEDKSKLSTLPRTLVVCLRRCPHPHCPDSREKEVSSPQRDFDCLKEIRSTLRRTLNLEELSKPLGPDALEEVSRPPRDANSWEEMLTPRRDVTILEEDVCILQSP